MRSKSSSSAVGSIFEGQNYLQLSTGETTTTPDTTVVLDGRASHNGTQLVNRTGSDGSGLSETGITSAVLATGLFGKKKKLVHRRFCVSLQNESRIMSFDPYNTFVYLSKRIGKSRYRTWSKWTRTRCCQSLRKSIKFPSVHQFP